MVSTKLSTSQCFRCSFWWLHVGSSYVCSLVWVQVRCSSRSHGAAQLRPEILRGQISCCTLRVYNAHHIFRNSLARSLVCKTCPRFTTPRSGRRCEIAGEACCVFKSHAWPCTPIRPHSSIRHITGVCTAWTLDQATWTCTLCNLSVCVDCHYPWGSHT